MTPTGKATLRLGARERSRLQAGLVVVICAMLFVAMRPVIGNLVTVREFQNCQTNVRTIAQALQLYSQEWDDSLPPSATWTDAALGYMAPRSGTGFKADDYLRCPTDGTDAPCSYAYNSLVEGLSITSRRTTGPEVERRRRLGRLDRAPMIIEKHGSRLNAALPLPDWQAVRDSLVLPHALANGATGSIIYSSGRPWYRSADELRELAGRKF